MQYTNILTVRNRAGFRAWLEANHASEKECYVEVKHGKPADDTHLWYLDAVEEALCFGWIDSTFREVNGVVMRRFSPRKKRTNWTELNKARARRLIRLGLMTEAGRAVLPDLSRQSFTADPETEAALRAARVWTKFCSLPALYRRIRVSNLRFYREKHPEAYKRMLAHTVEATRLGKTFGEWDDYGRLTDDR